MEGVPAAVDEVGLGAGIYRSVERRVARVHQRACATVNGCVPAFDPATTDMNGRFARRHDRHIAEAHDLTVYNPNLASALDRERNAICLAARSVPKLGCLKYRIKSASQRQCVRPWHGRGLYNRLARA
jgi:hypothetical protein